MSDFLATLSARTLGVLPVIAPRRSSHFEPTAVEPPENTPSTPDVGSIPVFPPRDATPPGAVPERRPSTRAELSDRDQSPVLPWRRAEAEGEPVPMERGIARPHAEVRPLEELPFSETIGRGPVPARMIKPTLAPGEPRPAQPSRAERKHGAERQQEPAAPAIHVTIGRVDVRAVVRPERPPAVNKPTDAPRLPLGAYLRGRND